MLHRACDKIIFFLPGILFHGILTAERSIYLRIPVSAFTAESRAPEGSQNTTAASAHSPERIHIRRIWYTSGKSACYACMSVYWANGPRETVIEMIHCTGNFPIGIIFLYCLI